MKTGLALIALLAAAGAVSAQSTYRWVDAEGRVHYSDQPPPPAVKESEEKRFSANRADLVPSYTVRRIAADFPVTLYSAENCQDLCKQARDLLGKRGVPFSERMIKTDADMAAYRQIFGAPDEVPAITVGRQTMKGFQATRWNQILDQVGYPTTPPPPQ